jgi:asparagine synthase (glutamine-hydrolysing)
MTWLPDDLLVKFDRMAMAHSLEGRAPYLDPKVVQAGLTLPPAQRMTSETSKVSLRRVARKWLPLEILERPKKGFVLPMADWMAQWFAENGPIQNYFAARPIPGLDPLEVSKVVEEDLKAGVRRERLLFALVLLVEWYQVFTAKRNQLRRQYTEAVDSDMCSLIS